MRQPDWWDEGEDPDYRFSLANERTFLAWIRTSLALLAGAVALVQLVPKFSVPGARLTLGIILAVTGLAVSATAYLRWASVERAMRHARALPFNAMLFVVAGALTVVGTVALILVAVGA